MRMLTNRSQIVADDMGLGKTSQALVAAKAWQIAFDYPILVVGPVNLKDNWFREAAGVGVRIEFFSSAKMPEPLEKPYILIADEAHFFQAGTHSQRGKAFLDLSLNENCVACYPLTGTPIKNGRPVNLFPLLKAVKAEIANDKKAYEKRYCNAGPTRFSQWDTSGASHLDELHVKCKPYMIRRTKKECLDLPAKIRTLRHVEMSATARKAYDQAFADMRAKYKRRLAAGEISDNAEALVMLTHLRRAGSIAKVESALEMAEEILEQGNSVVLFTEFVESAESICKALSSYGAELLTGDVTGKDGDTGLSKRQTMVDRFQNKTSRVFISTIRAGGVGITLTAASDVLLVDRPWTPGDAEQAEDRCYRIGQAATVNTQWLQANGVDEKIDQLLLDKSKRISLVLEGERKTMRGTGGSVVDVAKELLSEIFAK
jgi:SNF2 family DNA or RNA helicase